MMAPATRQIDKKIITSYLLLLVNGQWNLHAVLKSKIIDAVLIDFDYMNLIGL